MQTGASYINFKNITDMKDLVKTITHENQRSMDIQDHRDINKNRDDNTKYASNFSNFARSKAFNWGNIKTMERFFKYKINK